MLITDLITSYMDHMLYERNASSVTVGNRKYVLNSFQEYLKEAFKVTEAEGVKSFYIRSYLRMAAEAGKEANTICNYIYGIKGMFKHAVDRGIIEKSPAERIKAPRVDIKERAFLSWEELERFFAVIEPEEKYYLRNTTMLLTFIYTGVRLDELCHIRKEDLSPDLTELLIVSGKGDKSRLLPVHPFLQEALKIYLKEGCSNGEYLFITKNGKPFTESSVNKIIRKYALLAGIKKNVSAHIFRHSFATHLYRNKADINCISKLLGHVDIEKTIIYTHGDQERLRDAVLKL